jgi:hypothetical protein
MKADATMKNKINIRSILAHLVRAVLLYLLVFGVGFITGYFVKSELLVPRSDSDAHWLEQFSEEKGHDRVLDFQNTLKALEAGGAKSPDELTKQLDAQLRIEDLIIKSREAEYAKWTPFTPLFTGGVGAVLGFLTGLLGKNAGGSTVAPE